MSADLHCHTKLSNSSMGIDDLIILAKKKGLKTIAITDHDCQAGAVRGKIIAKRKGIEVIPGVELSATDPDTKRTVHILAYYCDNPERLEAICHKNTLARKKASQYMILKTAQKYPISTELVLRCATGSISIFEEHIMHALMECGVTNTIKGDLYYKLFNEESKENVIVNPQFVPVNSVIESIHAAGGVAVLSHPFLYNSFSQLDKYVNLGLDGVEVWCPSNTEEQTELLLKYAKNHNLVPIGGSEFSGMYSNKVCVGDYSTPDESIKALLMRKGTKK